MSNKEAVNEFYKKMRGKGFKNMSFLVHEDDAETVKAFINELKQKRLTPMTISPSETIERLKKLNLSNQQFQRIHHKAHETSDSHCNYLATRGKYQEGSNNDRVAVRVKCISEAVKSGNSKDESITGCLKETPLSC